MNNITVVGSGYVGMSLATLLSQHNDVTILDIDPARVDLINKNQSTIDDDDIQTYLDSNKLNLKATLQKEDAYINKDFIIIATPTNYDESTNKFDTRSVDLAVSDAIKFSKNALIVIKSTIPIGHTKKLQEKFDSDNIMFSPEFLREGKALYDDLHPSRIIIGGHETSSSQIFCSMLLEAAKKDQINIIFMPSTEAEAVKLFSNTYLAMRVAFFNELDSFAIGNRLNAKNIIEGVCMDSRIGNGYNNPSFGYGGYCLPKDTKQMLSNFEDIPQSLIEAIVTSNSKRMNYISDYILDLKPSSIGFYRLAMKKGSDNFRSSAILEVIRKIEKEKIKTFIYEPSINANIFSNSSVVSCLDEFKRKSDLIVANRNSANLNDCQNKVITRDIFEVD